MRRGGGGQMIKDTGPQIVDQARNPFGENGEEGGAREIKDPAMTHRIRFRRLVCPLHDNHNQSLPPLIDPDVKGYKWQSTRGARPLLKFRGKGHNLVCVPKFWT